MYTLRKINPEGVAVNISLGNVYATYCRFQSYNQFSHYYKELFGSDHVADLDENSNEFSKNCKMIVKSLDSLHPIYATDENYIMSDNGKTFEKL